MPPKFIRGDAIAGIMILFINIIGGLFIGTLNHGLGIGEALKNYTLLTIGDGLVAQIPSLLMSDLGGDSGHPHVPRPGRWVRR